MLEQSLL
ncbi:hypothetical protein BIW11_12927 [Tropilaelaps mercedesae]|nr:hypothetical protein BIW11_12927 [Tropilaelaps mercedesae]